MSKLQIDVISASAGSGKTYRLTQVLNDFIEKGGAPDKVMAVTFTKASAGILKREIRRRLLEKGHFKEVQSLEASYIGTVHAVSGRLLEEFAFDCGLPPALRVIPEDEASILFAQSLSGVAEAWENERFHLACQRLCLEENYLPDTRRIVDYARTNGILEDMLKASCDKSIASYSALFTESPTLKSGEFIKTIQDVMDKAIDRINAAAIAAKNARDALGALIGISKNFKAGRILWKDCLKLCALEGGAKLKEIFEDLNKQATDFWKEPLFREDLDVYIRGIYELASLALGSYARWKKERGFVDFADQEMLALELLKNEKVKEHLKERVEILLVDEFQDTNPIQLALFIELGKIAERTIWVGDKKQAIYSFRGTDPSLMQTAADQLIKGKTPEILTVSYRSRPELIRFANSIFKKCLISQGINEKEVLLNPYEPEKSGREKTSCLMNWVLDNASNKEIAATALAVGIKKLINQGADFPVWDKHENCLRPLKISDIAILVRQNLEAVSLGKLLVEEGVNASVQRSGLLETPECAFAIACLKYFHCPWDNHAAAEILSLTGYSGMKREDWLASRATEEGNIDSEFLSNIRAESEKWKELLSPFETLEKIRDLFNLPQLFGKWGFLAERLVNYEELLKHSLLFQDSVESLGDIATVTGFLRYLESLSDSENESMGRDKQGIVMEGEAVTILTYHGAKGLEWPLVILYSLESDKGINPFGIIAEAGSEKFDFQNPLKDRWIRYWPYPFEDRKKGAELFSQNAMDSSFGKKRQGESAAEEARLAYVGMTRARDYLVFATRSKKGALQQEWLSRLTAETGQPVLVFPPAAEECQNVCILEEKEPFQCIRWVINAAEYAKTNPVDSLWFHEKEKGNYSAAFLQASKLKNDHPSLKLDATKIRVVEEINIHDPIRISKIEDYAIAGDCIHAFLACDRPDTDSAMRIAKASRILSNYGLQSVLAPEQCLLISNALDAYFKKHYKVLNIYKEWPLVLQIGDQVVTGSADYIVETPEGFIVVDHKTFSGNPDGLKDKAQSFAAQLHIYETALKKSLKKEILKSSVYFSLEGLLVTIKSE